MKGYEIHHGATKCGERPFLVGEKNEVLGCINKKGNVWGTYLHGVFDDDDFRTHFLNNIRLKKNMHLQDKINRYNIENEFNRLSGVLRESLDMKEIYKIIGLK